MSVQTMDSPNAPPRLLRSLTLTHAVLYGLGVTIGAGIYVLVGIAAGRSGMHAPLALAVPLAGLADLTSRLTLVVFAIVNLALIRIKSRNAMPPIGAFICPRWIPFAGLVS